MRDGRRAASPSRRRDGLTALAFLAPFLLLLLIFQYVPLLLLLRDSVYSYPLLNPGDAEFVGLQNYADLLNDPETVGSFLVTLAFAAAVVALVTPVSFLLALFLDSRLPARPLVRTMVFLPVVTSVVVVATIWAFLLDPQNGLINGLLAWFGLGPFGFLTSRAQALPALVAMTVWQQVGFATILFLSGLQGIPKELGEAAMIDGATARQQRWHVTIPLLGRTTLFVVVVTTVFALQAFAPAFIMTFGGPEGSTDFVVYRIYQLAFILQQPGYASAITVVLLAIILLISLGQMLLLRVRWLY